MTSHGWSSFYLLAVLDYVVALMSFRETFENSQLDREPRQESKMREELGDPVGDLVR